MKSRLDTGNTPPISVPPRRLSPAMREVVRSAVAELDAKGITEQRVGQWGSPVLMVKKSSGAWRLCCDYREVNKHVVIPQQPLPRTDDILPSSKGKRYFSVMDMCHGFYQIEIEEEDRFKTGVVTPDCQRQYRRLPFGFASSPAIFQRMVDMLLGGMKWVWHEPALCPLGGMWLEALWQCRAEVINAHEIAADEGPDFRDLSITPREPRRTSTHQSGKAGRGQV